MSCFHTWAVVERSRISEAGDVVTLEACADCPTWRAELRFSPARDRADVELTVDRILSSLERRPWHGAVSGDAVRVRQSCSWCDEMVTLNPDGSPVFCSSCGHRGDVARLHCDCQRCRGPRAISSGFPPGSNAGGVWPR
jgi:hypothetical protein